MSDFSRLPRLGVAGRDRLEAASKRDGSAFLVEGRKHVADVLARGLVPVREVWLADDLSLELVEPILVAAESRRIPVGVASARDLEKFADAVTPQGVLAVADDPSYGLPNLVRGARGPLLLLDGVQDPGNVGAILRVAAAFGAAGVLVAEGSADPLGAKALRASAGTALTIPFARGSAAACRDALEQAGCPLWLLEGEASDQRGVIDLFEATPPPGVFALAVGNEGRGASAPIAAAARVRVSIPIAPGVESLNAAVAVGIACAFLLRPRREAATTPRERAAARPSGAAARVAGGPRFGGQRFGAKRPDTPRFDGPRADAPRIDGPRVDRARTERPRPELPKLGGAPRSDDEPRSDGPRSVAPRSEAPRSGGTSGGPAAGRTIGGGGARPRFGGAPRAAGGAGGPTDGPRRPTGPRRSDAGPRRPDAGSRRPDAGSRRPDAGPRRPDAGSRRPDAGPRRPNGPSRPGEAGGRSAGGPDAPRGGPR
jgi:TrmH family RNA methyltransferase